MSVEQKKGDKEETRNVSAPWWVPLVAALISAGATVAVAIIAKVDFRLDPKKIDCRFTLEQLKGHRAGINEYLEKALARVDSGGDKGDIKADLRTAKNRLDSIACP